MVPFNHFGTVHPLWCSLHTNTMILLSLASMSNCWTVCLYRIKKQDLLLLYMSKQSFLTDYTKNFRKISACHPLMMHINRLLQGFYHSGNTKTTQDVSFVFQDFSTLRNYLNLHLHSFKTTLELLKVIQCYTNNKTWIIIEVFFIHLNEFCLLAKKNMEKKASCTSVHK